MINRSFLLSLACLALAACVSEEAPDFCENHALFHAEHAASTAKLSVTMTEQGRIVSELQLPTENSDMRSTMPALQDSNKVYALQTTVQCATSQAAVSATNDVIVAQYASDCGADNKLGQVDVLLFDLLPNLNEVEVSVVTPATQKRFVINRKCESAIFRFK